MTIVGGLVGGAQKKRHKGVASKPTICRLPIQATYKHLPIASQENLVNARPIEIQQGKKQRETKAHDPSLNEARGGWPHTGRRRGSDCRVYAIANLVSGLSEGGISRRCVALSNVTFPFQSLIPIFS
jgi:hypothetical protein